MSGLAKLSLLENFEYRDAYLQIQVRAGIAYQMQALREKLGLTQAQFAELIGKPQSVVSRLEDTQYGRVTVQTLLDIASKLDIALLVRFVSYPEFLSRTEDKSVAALQPETITKSLQRGVVEPDAYGIEFWRPQQNEAARWMERLAQGLSDPMTSREQARGRPRLQSLPYGGVAG